MTLVIDEDDYDLEKIKKMNLVVDDSIILCVDPKNKKFNSLILKASKDGFKYPVMSSQMFDKKLSHPHLFLYLKYNHKLGQKNKDWKEVLRMVKFVIKHFSENKSSKGCDMTIVLDQKALDYLHDYTKRYKFKIGTDAPEQREITGKFLCIPLSTSEQVLITVEEDSTDMGYKEEAGYFNTIASFHSHPYEAYQKYHVCSAWPSMDDYLTVFNIYVDGYGAFHVVSTVEGLYIISISKTILGLSRESVKEDLEKYEKSIEENYRIDYPDCEPGKLDLKRIDQYVKEINSKPYFHLEFVEWKNAKKPIKITYGSTDGNCFITDEQIRFNYLIKKKKV